MSEYRVVVAIGQTSDGVWMAWASGNKQPAPGHENEMPEELVLTVSDRTEDGVKTLFMSGWNQQAGTNWATEEFDFVPDPDRFA